MVGPVGFVENLGGSPFFFFLASSFFWLICSWKTRPPPLVPIQANTSLRAGRSVRWEKGLARLPLEPHRVDEWRGSARTRLLWVGSSFILNVLVHPAATHLPGASASDGSCIARAGKQATRIAECRVQTDVHSRVAAQNACAPDEVRWPREEQTPRNAVCVRGPVAELQDTRITSDRPTEGRFEVLLIEAGTSYSMRFISTPYRHLVRFALGPKSGFRSPSSTHRAACCRRMNLALPVQPTTQSPWALHKHVSQAPHRWAVRVATSHEPR